MIGETLGKYQIIEHLGRGGMAEVYKAYQPRLDRHVAVKVLHTFLADKKNFLSRFQREAKAVATLRHPNIVQVHDFDYDVERDIYYMVMEFIDGPTLKVRLQELATRGEQMGLDEAIYIVTAMGKALDYAHQRGMVHRDVKPANIMFTTEGQVILTDFGIAKMVNLSGLTASGAMVGTPSYISPEQGRGQTGDERSDIYSLGIVFYQLITGNLPFDAESGPMAIILKHISEPPPSPRALRPDLPPEMEYVLMRTLAKDPAQRYQTAMEFVVDLRRAAAQTTPLPLLDEIGATPVMGQVIPKQQLFWSWLQRRFEDTPTQEQALLAELTPPLEMLTPVLPPAPIPATAPRRRRLWTLAILGTVILLLLLGTAGIMASRERLDDWLAGLRLLPVIGNTPTPDFAATQMAATVAALQATVGAPTDTPSATPVPTPTATPDTTATAVAACVFDIKVVSDRPVWSGVLVPGQQFVKRWEIKNAGTCAWPENIELAFVSGDKLEIVESPGIEPLPVGETTEIKVTLRAPTSYGACSGAWQLQDREGNPIGEQLQVSCYVGPTPTPRPTVTPTATITPALTPTPSEPLWMSVPILAWCNQPKTKGRAEWGWGGGPSEEYRHFYSQVAPEYEMPGPYREFSGFPHVVAYFTSSGTLIFPLPGKCGHGDYGRCGSPEEGYEIVWQKVYYVAEDCPQ